MSLCWQAAPASRPSFEQIDAMLEEILPECAIEDENTRIDALVKDEHARIFWKKYACTQSDVR
jgi:hypothetical protein